MSKPKFVFFKMFGCGHCVNVSERPTPQTSLWAKLTKDAELTSAVDFVMYEWGMQKDPVTKALVNHALAKEYSFVNYGPYFYLQNGKDSKLGLEMENVQRTHESMKKWILGQLKTNTKLKASSQQNQVSAGRPVAHPVIAAKSSQSRAANVRGAVGQNSWGNRKQLPPHVQKRITERKKKIAQLQGQSQNAQPVAGPRVQSEPIASPASQKQKFRNFQPTISRNTHLSAEPQQMEVSGVQLHARSTSKGMSFKPQKAEPSSKKFIARNKRK